MRTRVKICGITRPEDAVRAAHLGADAIGLVFFDKSPREVTIEQAKDIIAVLPPFVTVVGLFVDPSPRQVAAVLHRVPLDILQFHGNEQPGECTCYNKPYIKALKVREGVDLDAEAKRYASSRGLLLDTFVPGVPGGTGKTFNWSLIPKHLSKHIILAGGLTQKNVWQVISAVRPFAVDVSSGVEAEKGVKDPEKMAAFIRGVNNV
ncbi:phosphoribosylanthranilate isomerase [Kaarinaea lacus]